MSTNINISVGDNKLLAQATIQQNASRQAQLEKEADKRLQSEAEINRVKALAAKGKDANGNAIIGTRSQVPELERRPAANRQEETNIGMIWETLNTVDNRYGPTPGLQVEEFSSGAAPDGREQDGSITGQFNFLSGSGITSVLDYTQTVTNVPYPTDGYIWNPTMGYADSDAGAFPTIEYAYAYGPRTGRYITGSGALGNSTLVVLPTGRGAFILLRTVAEGSVNPITIDATADYFELRNLDGIPTSQRGLETVFAQELLPGATVSRQTSAFVVGLEGGGTEVIVPEPMTPVLTVGGALPPISGKAYFCSNKTVREITPVGMLADILNFMIPEVVSIEYTLLGQTVSIPSYQGRPGISSITYSGSSPATPNVYEYLNNIFNYTDPSNIILSADAIYRDATAGSAFSDSSGIQGWYESNLPLRHILSQYDPILEIYKDSLVEYKTSPNRDLSVLISRYIDVWDWNNPNYCRARLADLGVQPSAWSN